MRYGRLEDVLKLARILQGSAAGLSLADIQSEFAISRRTAERMRDAVARSFPELEEVTRDSDRIKRWRISSELRAGLVDVSATEIAGLFAASQLLADHQRLDGARSVETVALKLKALLPTSVARRIEPDLELLMRSEGLATRPGPRAIVDMLVVPALRQAMLASRKVRLLYRSRHTGQRRQHLVCPYGILYGERHYLVACKAREQYRLFDISAIQRVDPIDEAFERGDFSLTEYARRSFGIFQGEVFDVMWEFSPLAADEAQQFDFHPTQLKEKLPDGRLRVTFRASGLLEMARHLRRWGRQVKVIRPTNFNKLVEAEERAYWGT